MRWPRGRYNGRRIVGVRVIVAFDITHWAIRWPDKYGGCGMLGPILVWPSWEYEWCR